jgi:hypothetical protein
LPSFDDVTMRLHEAQQEHDRAREAMQAAGHKAGLYRCESGCAARACAARPGSGFTAPPRARGRRGGPSSGSAG